MIIKINFMLYKVNLKTKNNYNNLWKDYKIKIFN